MAVQSDNPTSMLKYFQALTGLRQSEPALTIGAYQSIDTGSSDVFAYLRSHEDSQILVVLNFSGTAHQLDFSSLTDNARVLLSTEMSSLQTVDLASLDLQSNEGLILRLL